jgi:predicted metalloprotease
VSAVLADTEDVWTEQFKAQGGQYRAPKLVLFRGVTPTACGQGQSAMGPFYCPGDQKVYIDLAFYDTLRAQLGAPGDFAQAYVIAHEVGHHVQNLLGVTDKIDAQRGKIPEARMNALSVRVELQADCLAGVWAFHADRQRHNLEVGDVEEALNAASKIGDDALQQQSRGTVRPETFTHGSSAQRVTWFKRGMASGRMADCNTFEARQL